MPIFEALGEFFGQILFEGIILDGPVRIYEWITGKEPKIDGYRTEQRKFIKFSVATKFLLTWEKDASHLKVMLMVALGTMNEKLTANDFQIETAGDKTIIHPPSTISFYSFHSLVDGLTEQRIKTVGVVETARTSYTVYRDPNSINLIGQTGKGKKFFISLLEDYSKRQFLRLNRDIETLNEFDVVRLKNEIVNGI